MEIPKDTCETCENYQELIRENESLKLELSENIIISSMNDMKLEYDKLKKSTVSIYKYNDILTKYNKIKSKLTTCNVVAEHLQKQITNNRFKFNIDKLQVELIILKELIDIEDVM